MMGLVLLTKNDGEKILINLNYLEYAYKTADFSPCYTYLGVAKENFYVLESPQTIMNLFREVNGK